MPRIARLVIPGIPHHITQRGNNRQEVFFTPDDRRVYLTLLAQYAVTYALRIDGYCLMTNHIHLVGTPLHATSLACAIGKTHYRYTQYLNTTYRRSGHLWQNRFFSCALDEAHFWTALCYVERNPVRVGLCDVADEYRWSSAAAHCGGDDRTPLLDLAHWAAMITPGEWRQRLRAVEDDAALCRLRTTTHTGHPLGDTAFLAHLSVRFGKDFTPRPVGRPKKIIEEVGKDNENR